MNCMNIVGCTCIVSYVDVVNVLFRCRFPYPEHIEECRSELLSAGEVEDEFDGAVDVINDRHTRVHYQVVVVMLVRVPLDESVDLPQHEDIRGKVGDQEHDAHHDQDVLGG